MQASWAGICDGGGAGMTGVEGSAIDGSGWEHAVVSSEVGRVLSQDELVAAILGLRAEAYQAGRRLPGRPALARMIGVSGYRIRQAMQEIARMERPHQVDDESFAHPTQPTSLSQEVNEGRDVDPDLLDLQPPVTARPARNRGIPASEEVVTESGELASSGVTGSQRGSQTVGRSWPLVIIGLAAAISVWSGWVGLGHLAGFGVIQPLPGVWDDFRLNSAIVLPVSVEAYAAYALRCWLTSRAVTVRARRFARWSAITSLVIGAAAQIAFHLMTAAGMSRAPWPVTVGVATVPVVVLGLATALANLIRTGGSPPRPAGASQPPVRNAAMTPVRNEFGP